MKTYKPKPCAWCGEQYVPTSGRQLYCSVSHRGKAMWRTFVKTATPAELAERYDRTNRDRAARNAYHRAYQREWRKTRTPEQIERHRQQQRAWYERKKRDAA